MNTGKTLFAQIMDFLPWSTFDRILPGEFGSANRTAVISSRYRSLHMSHVPVFARALLVQEFLRGFALRRWTRHQNRHGASSVGRQRQGGGSVTGTPKSPPPSGHRHVVGNHMVDGNGNNVSMACSGYNLNLSTAAATTSYSAASSAMASSVRRSSIPEANCRRRLACSRRSRPVLLIDTV